MSDKITVCSECLRASCWQGIFYCERHRTAGTITATADEILALNASRQAARNLDRNIAAKALEEVSKS